MGADDYERVAAPAKLAMEGLSRRVLNDLSESRGGVSWWDGQVDFRRRVVLSEYLMDSLNGAAEALADAALAAQDHREFHHADDVWMVRAWRSVAKTPAATNEQFIAACARGPAEARRERRIDTSATHAFSHALRVLDCLAAAFVVVAAIPRPVRTTDWAEVESLAKKCLAGSTSTRFEPNGSQGRELQAKLLGHVLGWESHGPTDWLPWLRSMRNGRTHRATRVNWLLLHGERKRAEGLLRPFPVQPDLTDIELMVRTPRETTNPLECMRILRRSPDVVDGLVASVAAFSESLAVALHECWEERRNDPTVLCQRGAQWQDLERASNLRFPGYGSDPELIGDELHVGTDLAKRLRSAHVMDADRSVWDD